MKLRVLYEDNHLIAVYKPAGVLVQADRGGEATLMDEVKKFLKEKYHKPGNVFLGLLHRLDRPVAGVVLFAKTSKGASRLSEQFRNHTIKKIYHALVRGKPKQDHGTLTHFLQKDHGRNKTIVFEEPMRMRGESIRDAEGSDAKRSGVKYAELDFRTLSTNGAYSFLEIKPRTGRSHQIRVQLAAIGCPIVGDEKYGSRVSIHKIISDAPSQESIALLAKSLRFQKATVPEQIIVSIETPYAWKKATRELLK